MKYLVIAAHPDDEVLGCGGTIARLSLEGNEVYIGILGEGITSRYAQPDQADKHLINALHRDSRKVAEVVGAKDLFMYDLPDNRFDTVPLLETMTRALVRRPHRLDDVENILAQLRGTDVVPRELEELWQSISSARAALAVVDA